MNWCRSCWQVTEPQKQVKQQAGLEASFSPTLKIAVPVTGLNGAHQYGGRLEKITPGMREEGLAGATMKMEARREHLGPRVSRATCCACLGLTSPPLHTHEDGVCACLGVLHRHLDTSSCPALVPARSRSPGSPWDWEHRQLLSPKI